MQRWIHHTALIVLLAWVAGPFAPTRLQADAPAAVDADADAMLADQFVIMMSDVLAGENTPRPDQLQRARILLDQALTLREDDAELWRLRAELATRMQDPDAHRQALRQYIRLRPDDDAAQLERFLHGLSQQQTLDDRLDLLEAILQARSAEQLSRPLRSRLATHAALAAQEIGDTERLDRWLTQAVRLDPANPDAAELVYALAQRDDAPAARGAALVDFVQAAPADPVVRLRLARWLTTQAAYDVAAQQFDAAATLAGGALPPDVYGYHVIALAAGGDVADARRLLDQLAPPASGGATQHADGIDAEAYPAVRLDLELLRLALLDEQPALVERGFARLQPLVESEDARTGLPDDAETTAPDQSQRLMLAWIAAVFNHQLDELPALLAELPDDAPLVRRARGWMHLHRGETREAAAQFEPIATDDPLAALGLARLHKAGSAAQAQALQAVVRRDGGGLAGLLAARQLRAADHRVPPTAAGSDVRRQMERAPLQLWRPALNVSPWTTMHLRVAPDSIGYLEPLYATIELRNTSRMPMPIQAGRGIPGRAMIAPSLTIGGQAIGRPAPTIVDVRRRLTLQPGETLRITVRLDRSPLGLALLADPTRTLSLQALAVLGPRPTRTGGVTAEPAGGVDSVRAITVRGTPITEPRLDEWLADLDSADTAKHLRALARLLRSIDHLPAELDTPTTRQRIVEPIVARFAEWPPVQQAWAVRFVSRTDRSQTAFRRILDSAERSDEPLVRLTFLATHLDEQESAALNAALRQDQPTIQTYAQALREAIEARGAASDSDLDDLEAGEEGALMPLFRDPCRGQIQRPISVSIPPVHRV